MARQNDLKKSMIVSPTLSINKERCNVKEITLALAKGRVAKQTLAILEKMSVKFSEFTEDTRKLVIWDDSKKVRLILVKAVDVPTYVETGAADIGIVGKDVIME